MKLLWISPRWPWPANDGARRATWNLLKEIPSGHAEIDLVCFRDSGKDQAAPAWQGSLLELPRRGSAGLPALRYLRLRLGHPGQPFTLDAFTGVEARRRFQGWIRDRRWDATVLDGLHGAPLLDLLPPERRGLLVYRAHNVESELWRQSRERESNPLRKAVLAWEELLYRKYEQKVCREAGLVLPVSEADGEKFRALGCAMVRALPIGMKIAAAPLALPGSLSPLHLLFVGRLDWGPNREGLRWLLEEVLPRLERPLVLRIIGSGEASWLTPYLKREPRLELLSNVPDLVPHYEWCHLGLIPLFVGSGTRVKAIEAASCGRTFISTGVGVEGLPFRAGTDYLLAESREGWVNALSSVSAAELQDLSRQVWQTAGVFSEERVAEDFLALVGRALIEVKKEYL